MKFSCLISCYHKDNPKQITEALNSLMGQTLLAEEIVIVEDGPLTEQLSAIINSFKEYLPIKRITLRENKGLGNALNVGLKHCSYDIVCRMDTDDICDKTRFERQVNFLAENPDVDIVGSWVKDIDEEGKIVGERVFPISHDSIYDLIWTCPFAHPTVAYRRDSILKVGSYRTDIKRRQDYDLWMRAAAKGLKFANIPEYLLLYRFTDEYYKKNNLKVAWQQGMMGYRGLKALKVKGLFPYLGVFSPILRAILPQFLAKPFHAMVATLDPRKKHL